jgi:hypothetical protein
MFGGSPISVAVPPMFEASTSAMRNGTGGTPSRSQTSRVTGATSSTVVTLSIAADTTPVTTIRITMIGNGRPRARLAAQIATYSNRPVRFSTPTMSIMPSSRTMTFQSMPESSEKNACSAFVTPRASMIAAPPTATATRLIFSVAIRAYAATKITTAIQAIRAPGSDQPRDRVCPVRDVTVRGGVIDRRPDFRHTVIKVSAPPAPQAVPCLRYRYSPF